MMTYVSDDDFSFGVLTAIQDFKNITNDDELKRWLKLQRDDQRQSEGRIKIALATMLALNAELERRIQVEILAKELGERFVYLFSRPAP